MSIKYLLPKEGKFYKSNLHCHSTNSDGKMTPEELKQQYKSKGYNVVAFTDHEILVDNSHLNDEDFIALTGCEISISEQTDKDFAFKKTTHLNLYSKDPACETLVAFDPRYAWGGLKNADKYKYFGEKFTREYTTECKNEIIEQANRHGFIVSYNHHAWTLESVEEVLKLKGLFAAEIYNYSNELNFCMGYSPEVIRGFAEEGIDIGCIATDDNHNIMSKDFDSEDCDSAGGITYIKAKEFTYDAIYEALKNKEFYCSSGAELYELFVDGRTVHIKCSPCQQLYVFTGGRRTKTMLRQTDEITEAAFELDRESTKYIRVMTRTKDGKCAFSKTYFITLD